MIFQIRFKLLLLRFIITNNIKGLDLHLLLLLLVLLDIIHFFLDLLSSCFGTSPITVGIIIFESLLALFLFFLIFFLVKVLFDIGLTLLFVL